MSGSKNCGTFTHGILRSRKKEGAYTLCNSMDGTGEHYAKWNKKTHFFPTHWIWSSNFILPSKVSIPILKGSHKREKMLSNDISKPKQNKILVLKEFQILSHSNRNSKAQPERKPNAPGPTRASTIVPRPVRSIKKHRILDPITAWPWAVYSPCREVKTEG